MAALKVPSSLGELVIDCVVHAIGVVGGRMYEYVKAKKQDTSPIHTSPPTTQTAAALYYTPQATSKPQSAADEYNAEWKHQNSTTTSPNPFGTSSFGSTPSRPASSTIFGQTPTATNPYPQGLQPSRGVPPASNPPAGPIIPVQAKPAPSAPRPSQPLAVDPTNSKTVASDFGFPPDLQVNNLSSGNLAQGLSQGSSRRQSGW